MALLPLTQGLYSCLRATASSLQQDLATYVTEANAIPLDHGIVLAAPKAAEVQVNDEWFTPPQVFPAIRIEHGGSRVVKKLGQPRRRDQHRLKITSYLSEQGRLTADATLANTDVQTALGLASAAFCACVQACLTEQLPGREDIVSVDIESYELTPAQQSNQLGIVQISEVVALVTQTVRFKHGPY